MNLRADPEVYSKLAVDQSVELVGVSYCPLSSLAASCYDELRVGECHSPRRGQNGDQPTLSEMGVW